MAGSIRTVLGRAARSYVVFVVLGLVIGLTLAPVAFQAAESDGTVAVVPLAGSITGGSAAEVTAMLEKARRSSDVKAVVIVANSGGGSASASETLYIQMKRTAEEMPVVTAVDAGALSGAYYAAAPSDAIYAKPSSLVGSVGVLTTAPRTVEPNNIVATTGPNKLTGGDDREFYRLLETLGNSFYNAVERQRGDRLELSRTELAHAEIYAGTQAVENGLADEIGGRRAAIADAARRAGLQNYDVRVLQPDGPSLFVSRANYLAADVPKKRMVDSSYLLESDSPAPTPLMVPGSYVVDSVTNRTVVRSGATPGAPTRDARRPTTPATAADGRVRA